MLHPFSEDTSKLSVSEIHNKIAELTQKYFRTSNPQLQEQIHTFIEFYKQEALIKEAKEKLEQENQENNNLDLDKLIKVS